MTDSIRAALEAKRAELAAAEAELANWVDYDSRRRDGSGAQDRRHEEMGESLRREVRALREEVSKLESQLQ